MPRLPLERRMNRIEPTPFLLVWDTAKPRNGKMEPNPKGNWMTTEEHERILAELLADHGEFQAQIEHHLNELKAELAKAKVRVDALAEAAAKWNALRNCARITHLGSSGIFHPCSSGPELYAHLTLNLWNMNVGGDRQDVEGRWCLDEFIRKTLLVQEAEKNKEQQS